MFFADLHQCASSSGWSCPSHQWISHNGGWPRANHAMHCHCTSDHVSTQASLAIRPVIWRLGCKSRLECVLGPHTCRDDIWMYLMMLGMRICMVSWKRSISSLLGGIWAPGMGVYQEICCSSQTLAPWCRVPLSSRNSEYSTCTLFQVGISTVGVSAYPFQITYHAVYRILPIPLVYPINSYHTH